MARAVCRSGAETCARPNFVEDEHSTHTRCRVRPFTRWDSNPAGKYPVELTLPDRIMQVNLTITDSASTPTAMFWPVGDNDGHVMTVTVKDTDLVLQAEAPRGHVEVVLERQGDRLTGGGRWGWRRARCPGR